MTHIFRLHEVEKYEYNFKRKPEYVHELMKSVLLSTIAIRMFSTCIVFPADPEDKNHKLSYPQFTPLYTYLSKAMGFTYLCIHQYLCRCTEIALTD